MADEPSKEESKSESGLEKIYWCNICRQAFDSKRCPQCGLKLKRVR